MKWTRNSPLRAFILLMCLEIHSSNSRCVATKRALNKSIGAYRFLMSREFALWKLLTAGVSFNDALDQLHRARGFVLRDGVRGEIQCTTAPFALYFPQGALVLFMMRQVLGNKIVDATPKAALNDSEVAQRKLVLCKLTSVHSGPTGDTGDDGFGALIFFVVL